MRKCLPLLVCLALACNLSALPFASAVPPRTATPIPSTTPDAHVHLQTSDIVFHPEPYLYTGDTVSLEVNQPPGASGWENATANVYLGARGGAPHASAPFAPYGLGERREAVFLWIWNTTGLTGTQTLVIDVVPPADGEAPPPLDVLTVTVDLRPAAERPMPEPLAHWAQAESVCCVFNYLTGTAAARDIERIKAQADEAFAHVETVLGVKAQKKADFALLSRLLGHGGFTAESIALTYIDRNPVGNNLPIIFSHEVTHLLSQSLTATRPTLVAEGLAVYVAGGHFKPEALEARAAALVKDGDYLPLSELANNFYPSQHEIGYLEGGAFVQYLVDTYGWEAFKQFYASFKDAPDEAQMLDAALQANFQHSLTDLETDWLTHLRAQTPTAAEIADRRLTVRLYDTLRRYQLQADPAAYFLTAWVPDAAQARERGITADFVRHPNTLENIALEAMLFDAERALENGNFPKTEIVLNAAQAVLDTPQAFSLPPAADYWHIVLTLLTQGYEAQTITLTGNTARVTAIRRWPELETLTLHRTAAGWSLKADY